MPRRPDIPLDTVQRVSAGHAAPLPQFTHPSAAGAERCTHVMGPVCAFGHSGAELGMTGAALQDAMHTSSKAVVSSRDACEFMVARVGVCGKRSAVAVCDGYGFNQPEEGFPTVDVFSLDHAFSQLLFQLSCHVGCVFKE